MKAFTITSLSNPLASTQCVVYRVAAAGGGANLVQLTDGVGGDLKFSEYIGPASAVGASVQAGVDFATPIVFSTGVEVSAPASGYSLTVYIGT